MEVKQGVGIERKGRVERTGEASSSRLVTVWVMYGERAKGLGRYVP